jgi:hypothetical protein
MRIDQNTQVTQKSPQQDNCNFLRTSCCGLFFTPTPLTYFHLHAFDTLTEMLV